MPLWRQRFHLVGHDWGGSIAWGIADKYPERLASLTILSRPHPNAFNRALALPDGDQKHRSRHHRAFLEPDAASVVLANDAEWLRVRWDAAGVPKAAHGEAPRGARQSGRHGGGARLVSRARRDPRAARARSACRRSTSGAMPTTRSGVRPPNGTREDVSGPYEFAVLPGGGHFTADQMPDAVNALLLRHLARNEDAQLR